MKKLIGWLIIIAVFGGIFFYSVGTEGLIDAAIGFVGAFALAALLILAVALIMPHGLETFRDIIREIREGEE